MGLSTLNNVRFAGMASCVPTRVLSNIDDCPPAMRSERERLVRNIGIRNRRICAPWQCFSDLALDATKQLISELHWRHEEIDALIVVTQSPDYPTPSTAIILQDRLGLPSSTIAFDVNLGCSAYPFGIHLMGSMIAAGAIKKGLLLVGDKIASQNDPLFSDAGTVTALEFDAGAPPMYFDLNSDGSGYKAIIKPIGGHREPYAFHHAIPIKDEDGTLRAPDALILDGPAILSFSTQRVPPMVQRALEFAGLDKESIDYFIFHQANRMINETIRKKLGLPAEKVPSTLQDFGNTSGASLPVTMTVCLQDTLSSGDRKKMLLCGFGIGLSWGVCILDIEGAKFPPLLESRG